LSKTDSEFPNLEASLAEVRRLRDENARLRGLLIEHGTRIPEFRPTSGIPQTLQTISAAPDIRRSAVGTAEQRIELFRISSVDATMFMPFAGRTPTGDLDTCQRQIAIGNHI
jgi:hypothetical protein